jgi:hypothetical protein
MYSDAVTLVIAAPSDGGALWVATHLRRAGVPTLVIAPQTLTCALRWEHRIGATGVRSVVQLGTGTVLESSNIRAVFNRIEWVSPPHWQGAAFAERAYAEQEITALLLSWLTSLTCPVINPPSAQGPTGAIRHVAQWRKLAAESGLRTVPYGTSSASVERDLPAWLPTCRLLHVGDAVLGVAPHDVIAGVRALATSGATPFLCAEFIVDERKRWQFVRADPRPDPRLWGSKMIAPLVRWFGLPSHELKPERATTAAEVEMVE